ncbi:MAG TPA: VanW family protein, partial [Firmicutes bacterium]|nr:VanW family protein [Bacillota bacterium]
MKKKIIPVIVILCLILAAIYVRKDRIRRYWHGVAPGVTLNGKAMDYMLKSEVERYVRKKAAEVRALPQNAYFVRETGEIMPEKPGFFLNISWTVNSVMEAAKNESVALKTIKVDPKITKGFLEKLDKEIGSYSTIIGGGGNRAVNIRLATNALNYYLLAPGEVFSFNKANGPRTYKRGYLPAPIIVGNSVVPG